MPSFQWNLAVSFIILKVAWSQLLFKTNYYSISPSNFYLSGPFLLIISNFHSCNICNMFLRCQLFKIRISTSYFKTYNLFWIKDSMKKEYKYIKADNMHVQHFNKQQIVFCLVSSKGQHILRTSGWGKPMYKIYIEILSHHPCSIDYKYTKLCL